MVAMYDTHAEVAPFAGAWIEIYGVMSAEELLKVAPFAGAWIEIYARTTQGRSCRSLPSRERGLKFVAVLALSLCVNCRSLRGSVD